MVWNTKNNKAPSSGVVLPQIDRRKIMSEKNLAGIRFPGLDGVYMIPNIGEGGGDVYMVRCSYDREDKPYIIGEFNWSNMETAYKNGCPVFLQISDAVEIDGTFPSDASVAMYSIYYLDFADGMAFFRMVNDTNTSLITIYDNGRIERTNTSNLDYTLTKNMPANAKAVGDALKSTVKSVNGQSPDPETGNVQIPYFNLTEMGLSEIPLDGTPADTVCDTTELLSAVKKGPVFVGANFSGEFHSALMNGVIRESDKVTQLYGTMCIVYEDGSSEPYAVSITILDGQLIALVTPLATGAGGAVLYTKQTLTDEQKTQARQNIGAVCQGDYGIIMQGKDSTAEIDVFDEPDEAGYKHTFLSFNGYEDGTVKLSRITDGTEDWDAATVGQLNAAVGDISTALDSIIAMQEELIGGESA
jgi:hypothetical protein